MSLNKFTSSSEIKDYLKIGCSELNTQNLKLNGNPVISGYYIPRVNAVGGGNFTNINCRYTIIGNIMTLSLVALYETTSSSNAYQFNFEIPNGFGYKLDNTLTPNVFSCLATLTPAITGTPMLGINAYPAGLYNVTFLMKNFSTDYPVGTFCNLNATITCSIKNL